MTHAALLAGLASLVAPLLAAPLGAPTQETPAPQREAVAAPAAPSASRMESLRHDAKLLGTTLNVAVYLPPGYDESGERYPVLYFLHGLWGNAGKWAERGTPATLDALIAENKVPPMIVVCPDGQNSMYVNALETKAPWGDFLATELVETIDAKYRTVADRAARGINGDSMGGYGALNVAFKHPTVFGSVSAHSAAIYPVDPTQLPDRIKQFAPQWKPVYGWPIDVDHWKAWNPLELAATLPVETLASLEIYFDCGDKDRYGFDKTNAQLHEILEGRKVAHQWHLRSGGHGRDYFSEYVPESLVFHGAAFDRAAAEGSKRSAPAKGAARREN
ncbi:MAG: hypothetical protein JNL90_04580 [Planctomycetes bacterium]|nr:hypothetical protein [Planctomycetota bacterium]